MVPLLFLRMFLVKHINPLKQNIMYTKTHYVNTIWLSEDIDAAVRLYDKVELLYTDAPYGTAVDRDLRAALRDLENAIEALRYARKDNRIEEKGGVE